MTKERALRAAIRALTALYVCLPKVECKRHCQSSCHLTQDLIGDVERDALNAAVGPWLEVIEARTSKLGADLSPDCIKCPLLVHDACTQYGIRPLICRLWGIVDDKLMRCPWGCKPTPRYLSNDEVVRIWGKMKEIDRRYREAIHNSHREIHEKEA